MGVFKITVLEIIYKPFEHLKAIMHNWQSIACRQVFVLEVISTLTPPPQESEDGISYTYSQSFVG